MNPTLPVQSPLSVDSETLTTFSEAGYLKQGTCTGSGWDGVNFIAACMVLCFGFVSKTVLMITHQRFGYC